MAGWQDGRFSSGQQLLLLCEATLRTGWLCFAALLCEANQSEGEQLAEGLHQQGGLHEVQRRKQQGF
jgi:hypothetical protein